ncbi:MAG: biotin--[acetyl-CoA-carboxylase] ligase [Bacteroidales bacterium]|jgi:BirA family biotin operon repressor/biotin-[acetyl-CoA-carboxylase] ligase
MKVFNYDIIDSTNLEAQRLLSKDYKPPFVITANYQTDGKGQGSNIWTSEKNLNLMCSYVIEPLIKAQNQYLITVATSVSILMFLQKFLDVNKYKLKIKWPNDIYVDDNKISGILVANKIFGDIIKLSIVGIGININQTDFSPNIPNPISLKALINKDFEIENILNILSEIFLENINVIKTSPEKLIKIYRNSLYKIGEPSLYTINGEKKICTIADIDNYGNIIFAKE